MLGSHRPTKNPMINKIIWSFLVRVPLLAHLHFSVLSRTMIHPTIYLYIHLCTHSRYIHLNILYFFLNKNINIYVECIYIYIYICQFSSWSLPRRHLKYWQRFFFKRWRNWAKDLEVAVFFGYSAARYLIWRWNFSQRVEVWDSWDPTISRWWQLKYILFSSLFGEDSHFDDHIFQMGVEPPPTLVCREKGLKGLPQCDGFFHLEIKRWDFFVAWLRHLKANLTWFWLPAVRSHIVALATLTWDEWMCESWCLIFLIP